MSAVYQRQIFLPVTADDAYAWHNRPGAIYRLMPPWEPVEVVREVAGLHEGAVAEFIVRNGPIPIRWIAQHSHVVPGQAFCDRQQTGPFAQWEHFHEFAACVPSEPGLSKLTDRITYRLPGGRLAEWIAGGWVRRKIDRMFDYRHATTLADLQMHHRYKEQGMLTVSLTGSHGLVGSALQPLLTTGGHRVIPCQRNSSVGAHWDPQRGTIDPAGLLESDAVVHLAGANIAAARWNATVKQQIRDSRVMGTALLARTLATLPRKPKCLICASAIGYYGDAGDQVLDESSPRGSGFLADVCEAWEAAADPAREAGIRVVHLRFGMILSRKGGALAKMLLPFKMGVGGVIGAGTQYWSWISLEDAIRSIVHAIMTPDLAGAVNAVAPHPATNREFTKTLGEVLRRPTVFPMPAFAARLAFGEMADHLMLASTRVIPTELQRTHFEYRFPQLADALA